MTAIAGLHRIELETVSAFVLETDAGRVLVDAGYPHTQEALAAELERIGQPDLIVLTHAHPDHVGGLAAVRSGAQVAAHSEEAPLLRRGETMRPLIAGPHCPDDLRERIKHPVMIDPVEIQIELSEGDTVPGFPGLTVVHTPGHSAGHISLLWDHAGGVLVVGDAAANFGQVVLPPVAEDFTVTEASVRRLAELDFDVAVFGHGEPIESGASEAFRRVWSGATVK